MDEKNSQLFGCFLGILTTCFIAVVLFWFVDLALWLEYVIIAVLAAILGPLGVLISKKMLSSSGGLPQQYVPVQPQRSPEPKRQPNPNQSRSPQTP